MSAGKRSQRKPHRTIAASGAYSANVPFEAHSTYQFIAKRTFEVFEEWLERDRDQPWCDPQMLALMLETPPENAQDVVDEIRNRTSSRDGASEPPKSIGEAEDRIRSARPELSSLALQMTLQTWAKQLGNNEALHLGSLWLLDKELAIWCACALIDNDYSRIESVSVEFYDTFRVKTWDCTGAIQEWIDRPSKEAALKGHSKISQTLENLGWIQTVSEDPYFGQTDAEIDDGLDVDAERDRLIEFNERLAPFRMFLRLFREGKRPHKNESLASWFGNSSVLYHEQWGDVFERLVGIFAANHFKEHYSEFIAGTIETFFIGLPSRSSGALPRAGGGAVKVALATAAGVLTGASGVYVAKQKGWL